MDLSIIIVNYNTQDYLKNGLRSILESDFSCVSGEIIVVDNASSDDSVEMLTQEFRNIRVIQNKENVGFAKAVNQGIKKSKGNFVLVLNPDVVFLDKPLVKMISFLRKNPKVGMLAPKLINSDGSVQKSCLRFCGPGTIFLKRIGLGKIWPFKILVDRYLMNDFNHRVIKEVDWVIGSTMLLPRSVIEKVGMMDEDFFLYFEDVDWCRRIKKAGLKIIYFPEVEMLHRHLRASAKMGKGFSKHLSHHIKSAFHYFKKHGILNKSKVKEDCQN